MTDPGDLRPNEEAVELEPASDASLRFIGTIRTPWRDRKDCPRQGNTMVRNASWFWTRSGTRPWRALKTMTPSKCSTGSTRAAGI